MGPPPGGGISLPNVAGMGGPQLGGGGANFAVGAGASFNSAATSNIPTSAATADATTPIARPKFLASETNARALAPVEPWAASLRLLMIVFGTLLVATFVAPWTTGEPHTTFSWQVLSRAPTTSQKLLPIAIVVAGLLALVLGILPASTRARGAGALAAGGILFALFGFAFMHNNSGPLGWRGYAIIATMLTGPAGLLLRAKYPASPAARVLGTIAGLATLAVFLIPIDGQVPIKALKLLTDQGGTARVIGYSGYLVLAAGAACLMVWMPPSATPLATLLAWANILLVPILIATVLIVASSGEHIDFKLIARAPVATIYPMIWFAAASALYGYGMATLIGKTHEKQAA